MVDSAPFPAVDVTFSPAWWYVNYGLGFEEEAWRDPIRRTERDRDLRRLLYERFGDVGLGERDPKPQPNIEAYGHRFMAALWGCEIRYLPNQAPAAVALPDAAGRMANPVPPDFDASPVIQRAFAEAKLLGAHYGFCEGGINLGGPLNNAVSVFGEEILYACLAQPDLARQVLKVMAVVLLAVYDRVTCPINHQEVASPRPSGGIGNCPVCMISPETYRQVVLPADLWWRGHFAEFSLHHCGVFHPYAEVYQALQPAGLDVGWGTDLKVARRAYPRVPMSLELQDSAVMGKSESELDALLAQMVEEAGPRELVTRIWLAEACPDTPDSTVRALMTAPRRLTKLMEE